MKIRTILRLGDSRSSFVKINKHTLDLRNALIVHDESHLTQDIDMELDQFLTLNGLAGVTATGDPSVLEATNAYYVSDTRSCHRLRIVKFCTSTWSGWRRGTDTSGFDATSTLVWSATRTTSSTTNGRLVSWSNLSDASTF